MEDVQHEFELYEKFVVFKRNDAYKYLSEQQKKNLDDVLKTIKDCRQAEGKLLNSKYEYIICNGNEPYIKDVIEAIERGENVKATMHIGITDGPCPHFAGLMAAFVGRKR